MDLAKNSSLEEYEHETTTTMAPSQRIADQQYQIPGDSPRGRDLAAAAGPSGMSARAAIPTPTTDHSTDHGTGTGGTATSQSHDTAPGDDSQRTWSGHAKSDRRLVFADESGGALAEITYSSRTHYSKQATSGALPAGRACCVIS